MIGYLNDGLTFVYSRYSNTFDSRVVLGIFLWYDQLLLPCWEANHHWRPCMRNHILQNNMVVIIYTASFSKFRVTFVYWQYDVSTVSVTTQILHKVYYWNYFMRCALRWKSLVLLSSKSYYDTKYATNFLYCLLLLPILVNCFSDNFSQLIMCFCNTHFEGILPKGPYLPCLSMADRALLAGYPWIFSVCLGNKHLAFIIAPTMMHVGDASS